MKRRQPPTPLEPKIKERKTPPCPENSKMSKTGISKKWIETKKNEDGKFSITKCVKFNEPTVSTSKKVKKISKAEKYQKIQKEQFKSFFVKSQSDQYSDRQKSAPSLESIPKPGVKINLQPVEKKKIFKWIWWNKCFSKQITESPRTVQTKVGLNHQENVRARCDGTATHRQARQTDQSEASILGKIYNKENWMKVLSL